MDELLRDEEYEPELCNVGVDLIRTSGPDTGSIRGQGFVYTIITLRERDDGEFDIGDGNQRYRELVESGAEEVMAWVFPPETPDHVFYGDALCRNYRRRHNPVHEGEMLADLVGAGRSIKGLAKDLGTSASRIETLIGVSKLPESIRGAVFDGKVAHSTVMELAKMTPDQVSRAIDILRDTGKITGANVRDIKRGEVRERIENMRLFEVAVPAELSPRQRFLGVARSLLGTVDRREMIEWVKEA